MPDIPCPTVKFHVPLPKIRYPKNLGPALLCRSIPRGVPLRLKPPRAG